ncbi:DUF6575 domain-containing protein [Roseivirga pacifica]|uniref:DUF6575 domain-containing protein n=1 Tax=Roseivirga pacifica TaxID=1267423 RepID=UPI003BA8A66F
MDKIGVNIDNLPFGKLERVEDLISYEGPVLTHYRSRESEYILFYWVDFGQHLNRWLVKSVPEKAFVEFLKKKLSLNDIVIDDSSNVFCFLVDIDSNQNMRNISLCRQDQLDPDYLPEQQLYFSSAIPSVYDSLIEEYSDNFYVETLRENAVYMKIEPVSKVFGTTVSILDASKFLKNISNSLTSFIEFDFIREYGSAISFDRVENILKGLKKELSPRLVYSQYGSFEVGISTYSITLPENQRAYRDWVRLVIDNYKRDVVSVNYNSKSEVDYILDKFDENARNSIYKPFLEIVNNKSLKFEARSSFNSKPIKLTSSLDQVERILPPKKELQIEAKTEKRKLYNMVIEVKGDNDISKIRKREIDDGLLFSHSVEEVELPLHTLKHEDKIYQLSIPVIVNLKIDENNTYEGRIDEFGLTFNHKDKETVLQNLIGTLVNDAANGFSSKENPEQYMASFNEHL